MNESTAATVALSGVGWQPIATAPKDGTRFLAWNRQDGMSEFLRWQAGRADRPEWPEGWRTEFIAVFRDDGKTITHWMPLPAPPATA